jgi:hypothetical protein
MTDAAIDMDRFKSKRQPTKRQPTTAAPPSDEGGEVCNAPTRLPRQQGYWAPVPLEVLTDRRHWGLIPARFRLLLYIQIKSRRGEKPIPLTNAMAEEIGLNRRQKWVWLGALEAEGYVTVEQIGKRNPIVASRSWSIEEP